MKSYKKVLLLSALAAAFAASSAGAFADGSSEPKDLSVTVGLKAWANEWVSWNLPGSSQTPASNTKTAINPSVTVKYKNFFVSGGMMPKTTYDIPGSITGTVSQASRKEMDLSVGYYVHPQVGLTLGYKQITQTWGTSDYVWKIPAVGVSAAASIQETKFFMYGNFAVGRASLSTTPSTIASTWNMKGGTYTTSEVGMGYSFTPAFRLTAGYKSQSIPTSLEAQLTTARINMVDSTRGVVLGGSYTF